MTNNRVHPGVKGAMKHIVLATLAASCAFWPLASQAAGRDGSIRSHANISIDNSGDSSHNSKGGGDSDKDSGDNSKSDTNSECCKGRSGPQSPG